MRASNMLLSGVTLLLASPTIVQAAAIQQTPLGNMSSSAVTGFKNVAYFVNWVCSLTEIVENSPLTMPAGYLWSQLQPTRSPC